MTVVELFKDARTNWDLEALYAELADIKGCQFTQWEKDCLRGLLCNCTPQLIAEQIGWTPASLRTELCKRIYPYIYELISRENEQENDIFELSDKKDKKWINIPRKLEDLGLLRSCSILDKQRQIKV